MKQFALLKVKLVLKEDITDGDLLVHVDYNESYRNDQ